MHQKLDQYYRRYIYPLPMMLSNKTFRHLGFVYFQEEEEERDIKKLLLFIYSNFMLSVEQQKMQEHV